MEGRGGGGTGDGESMGEGRGNGGGGMGTKGWGLELGRRGGLGVGRDRTLHTLRT